MASNASLLQSVPDWDAAFTLCLEGLPDASFCYPGFAARIEPYLGWLDRASTLTVRFEELRNTATQRTEMAIIARYLERVGLWSDGESSFVEQALASLDPSASHTFRKGGVGTWRERLSDDQADRLEHAIAPVARLMGYSLINALGSVSDPALWVLCEKALQQIKGQPVRNLLALATALLCASLYFLWVNAGVRQIALFPYKPNQIAVAFVLAIGAASLLLPARRKAMLSVVRGNQTFLAVFSSFLLLQLMTVMWASPPR